MKILIPPAKEMNKAAIVHRESISYADQTYDIVQELSSYSVEKLQRLYSCSMSIAEKEYMHIQQLVKKEKTGAAMLVYDGLMYRQLKRPFQPDEEEYIQKHIYITSALYGVIPAMQQIGLYRLDFTIPLTIQERSLSKLWRPSYDACVKEDEQVISFLSAEFESVFSSSIRQKWIQFVFKEEKDGQFRVHSTGSKKARGRLLDYLIRHQIEHIDTLKTSCAPGMEFLKEQSTDKRWTFIIKD